MLSVEQIKDLIRSGHKEKFYWDYSWRKLSSEVLNEQHGECQICKANGKFKKAKMVHHVNHLDKRPDLAYCKTYIDPIDGLEYPNLIALCMACHEAEHPDRQENFQKWLDAHRKKEEYLNEEWFG